MIFKRIWTPDVEIVEELNQTERGDGGFGSTNKDKTTTAAQVPIPPNIETFPTAAAAASLKLQDSSIEFSTSPFDHEMEIKINTDCDHPTLGLDIQQCATQERPQLLACAKGTPAGRIQKWRSTIQNGFILAVKGQRVKTIADIKRVIRDNTDP